MIKALTLGQKIELVVLGILAVVCIILAIIYIPKPREVVYNCTWAEISPDIPPKVREECRKLRMDKIK